MQFLAGHNTMFGLFVAFRASILLGFGIVLAVTAVLFIAAYNNYFIERSLNKLSKKLQNINEKLNDKNLLSEERLDLEKQRETLEQKAKEKLNKAFATVKTSSRRLKKFNIYLEKHANKYPDLLNTYGEDVKTLKQLFETSVLEGGRTEQLEPETYEEYIEEDLVQPVLQQQKEEVLKVEPETEETVEENKLPSDLSADGVIYRRKQSKKEDDFEITF